MAAVDLVVVGGGMAGLTAAARAATGGGRVVLVEKAAELGGSGRYAGFLWTTPTDEVMDDVNPSGDLALRRALVAGFPAAMEWVRSLDVPAAEEVAVIRYGRGRRIDTALYLRNCERVLRDNGGEVLLGAEVTRLRTDGGRVVGVDVTTADGASRSIDARWTLLSSGGFQGDRALIAELVHENAPMMPLRSNPVSAGAGLRLGRSVGAGIAHDRAGFYGHLVLAGVPLDDPYQFANQTLYYSEHALVFNLHGERFVDETVGDHLTANATVAQPEARCLVVADQRVRDEHMLGSYVQGIVPVDRLELARKRGGRYAVAESLDDFSYLPAEWGYPGDVIRREIERFNETARAGGPLDPGRRFDLLPLDKPPYYVIEAVAAITYTFTGVRIDADAHALDESGNQVPGLLAAGADAGGLARDGAYMGGLANACVFGMRAAATALAG